MRKKRERYSTILARDNVIESGKPAYFSVRNQWNTHYFKNTNPMVLELGCGRGEYTLGMAALFPEKNFIGVDIKGDRLWKGSTLALERNLTNTAFLRTHILVLEVFFGIGEVDEIWLVFPDPRPKKREAKKRLTNARFLDCYKKIMKPGGVIRLKTDNTVLFDYTLEELAHRTDIQHLRTTYDLYQSDLRSECFDIKTRYEDMFLAQGETIKYLRFSFAS